MEKKGNKIIKKLLFAFIMLFLFLPLIQNKLQFIELRKLKGSFTEIENPYISVHGWFEVEYQKQQEEYIKETLGFRNFFVRLNNQIDYSFFNKANAEDVLVGKDNYLFSRQYIITYLGRDFVGQDYIDNKLKKLRELKDTLRTKDIDIIVVIPPGKGGFYSEYIPDSFLPEIKSNSNYESYISGFDKNSINYLDFNQWFKEVKDTSQFPLYPKNGTHWSAYGEYLAADSIIQYISVLRSINLPTLALKNIEISDSCRYSDQDIENSMNLLFDIPDLEMAYPIFEIIEDETTVKPKVLTIADSFYWGMYNWGMSSDVYDESKFWYYNKQIYPDNLKDSAYVDEATIISEVEKNDVVVLMSTDRNLFKFAYGFIDQLHKAYFGESEVILSVKEKRIRHFIKSIRSSPNWMRSIEKKAIKENIAFDEAIRNNAEYMVWKEEKNKK